MLKVGHVAPARAADLESSASTNGDWLTGTLAPAVFSEIDIIRWTLAVEKIAGGNNLSRSNAFVKFRIGLAAILVLAIAILLQMNQENASQIAADKSSEQDATKLAETVELVTESVSDGEHSPLGEYPSREALQQRGEIARQRTLEMLVQPSAESTERKGYPISIENLPARGVIDLYGQVSRRVVILGPQVPLNNRISVLENDPETPKERMLEAIRSALEKEGIILQEAGEKFLFVINPRVTKQIPELVVRDDATGQRPGNSLQVENIRGEMLVDIYESLSGRKAQGVPNLPHFITFRTSGLPLTINELMAAIEVLFELRGFKFEHRGSDSFVIETLRSP